MYFTKQSNRDRLGPILSLVGSIALLGAPGCQALDAEADSAEAIGSAEQALHGSSNQIIIEWNLNAHDAMVAFDGHVNPVFASRMYAMTHIAMHDAVNSIYGKYESYAFQGFDPWADPAAAAAAAAHGVLVEIFPDQQATLDQRLAESLARVPNGWGEYRGVYLGQQAADAIIAVRADDNSQNVAIVGDFTPIDEPGHYQVTPPLFFVFAPDWRYVTPFSLSSPSEFRSSPPPQLDTSTYAQQLEEVKALGRIDSTARSVDDTYASRFWEENSDIGWNRITRVAAAQRGLDLWRTARLFALVNMALADSYIAGWDSKLHYDLWRPYTAIREADTDGNPATTADAAWEPLLNTPPIQDYPSTHSALGDAAARVLTRVVGDDVSFGFESPTADPANTRREFDSFSEAANENAASRVTGGLHFRFACDAGQALGRRIGDRVVDQFLRRR